jgi:hypothetical protein
VHYWNRDNFEGLAALASALREHPHLGHLGEYCARRERGLRRQALSALDAFLAEAETWSDDAASRNLCRRARAPRPHAKRAPVSGAAVARALSHPHARELGRGGARQPQRWLGLLERDPERLARALSLAPDDVPVRRRLVDLLLGDVDFPPHHLGDGRLIGDVASARQSLAGARAQIDAAPDPRPSPTPGMKWRSSRRCSMTGRPSAAPPTAPSRSGAPGAAAHRWPVIIYYGKKE